MGKFILCRDIETKQKLLAHGYPLLNEYMGAFLFANIECKTANFDNSKVVFTDRMTF